MELFSIRIQRTFQLVSTLRKELFEKHEEYSVIKQVSNFLSIAHSHASSS